MWLIFTYKSVQNFIFPTLVIFITIFCHKLAIHVCVIGHDLRVRVSEYVLLILIGLDRDHVIYRFSLYLYRIHVFLVAVKQIGLLIIIN